LDKENLNKKGFYGTNIYVLEFNLTDGKYQSKNISFDYDFNYIDSNERKIALTNQWKFIINNNELFLYVGFLLKVTTRTIAIFDTDFRLNPKVIERKYFFNDKILRYNQLSTIECYDNTIGTKLWKTKIKGYIYTNVEYKDGCIVFGTAGKGGALYCISLASGDLLTEYSNTDASSYEWRGNCILIRDAKGNLIKIDPFKNLVINKVLLKDKIFHAPILSAENLIFSTVHNRKKNSTKVVCISDFQPE
jgi:hypothetical protein